MTKITFEKDGKKLSVEGNAENVKCMEGAGWVKVVEQPAPIEQTIPESATIEPLVAKKKPGRPSRLG